MAPEQCICRRVCPAYFLVRSRFQHAFEANGGVERLVQWIKEDPDNERVFYQIYSKLFPIDVNANARGDVTFTWKAPQLPPKMSARREPAPQSHADLGSGVHQLSL
jgi:hypothetical protein